MAHQLRGSGRTDDVKRFLSRAEIRTQPAREPKVRNAHRVVGMEMGQEQGIDFANRHSDLKQPDCRAAAGIDQDGMVAGFDQRSGTEALGTWNGNARAEQRYTKCRSHLLRDLDPGVGHHRLPVRDLFVDVSAILIRCAACRLGADLRKCLANRGFFERLVDRGVQ